MNPSLHVDSQRPIVYVARVVPAYRRPVLESLDEHLGGRLVVAAGLPPRSSSLRSIGGVPSESYRRIELTNRWLNGEAVHAQFYRRIFRECGTPAVVLAEESPRSVTLPFLLRHARLRGAKRLLWGHFSSNSRAFGGRHVLDRYRIRLAQSVEGCVCYTHAIAESLRAFVPSERVFVAANTLDTDALSSLRRALDREGRAAVRRRLGLEEDEAALAFIGRLLKTKGTERLTEVFRALRARRNATLFVIGTGPEEAAMKRYARRHGLDDVRFFGAMPDWKDSAPYLFAADLMLMPGYVGLAVNHAFSFGLPVVTRRSPDPAFRFHSPEIAYLRDGHNGRLAASDRVEDLLFAVEDVLADRERYSLNALTSARQHLTLGKMVDGLVEAIRFAEGV